LLFSIASGLDAFGSITFEQGLMGWIGFLISTAATGILMLLTSFFAGLPSDQRRNLLRRVRAAVIPTETADE